MTPTWRTLGIRDKDSFLAWIDKACAWFKTIQDLANGSKHFALSESFRAEHVGAPPLVLDDPDMGLDVGSLDGPVPYVPDRGTGCLLIDYGEGAGEHRWKTARALLDAVVRFWRKFFARFHPDPEVRAGVKEGRLS